jgi:hypothetical protein
MYAVSSGALDIAAKQKNREAVLKMRAPEILRAGKAHKDALAEVATNKKSEKQFR